MEVKIDNLAMIVGNTQTHFDELLVWIEAKIYNLAMIVGNMEQSNNGHRQTTTEDKLNHNHTWTPIDVERPNVVNQDLTFTLA